MARPTLGLAFQAARPLARTRDPRAFFSSCRALATIGCSRTSRSQALPSQASPCEVCCRWLSTTTPRQATVVLRNPRVDEDGKDMTIQISERAAKRLKQITTSAPPRNTLAPSPSSSDSHLRVTVTSGGCHGFQYLMSLEQPSKIDPEEDTVFAANDSGDGGIAEVVMDQASLELLQGSTVDFTQELIGSQFKIVGNPRASSSCGCGTSFDIE